MMDEQGIVQAILDYDFNRAEQLIERGIKEAIDSDDYKRACRLYAAKLDLLILMEKGQEIILKEVEKARDLRQKHSDISECYALKIQEVKAYLFFGKVDKIEGMDLADTIPESRVKSEIMDAMRSVWFQKRLATMDSINRLTTINAFYALPIMGFKDYMIRAMILIQKGKWNEIKDILPKKSNNPEEMMLILLFNAMADFSNRDWEKALKRLKEARKIAVKVTEPLVYAIVSLFIVMIYDLIDDRVNALANGLRAKVSLEDLYGEGSGAIFDIVLNSLRLRWGEELYRKTVVEYIQRRKTNAI